MFPPRVQSLIFAPLVLLLSSGMPAGTLIKPVGVTTTIAGDAGSSHLYLLDDNPAEPNAGLQDGDGVAVTLDSGDTLAKALATFAYRAGDGHEESWTRPTPSGNPVFVFDLGSDLPVGSVILWQYGNNGGAGDTNGGNATRDFSLIFHTELEGDSFDFGTESVEFSGTMDPIYGDTTPENPAQVFFFGSEVTARYIALRIDNNYLPPADPQITSGGDRYGLGEVRFATDSALDPQIGLPETVVANTMGGVNVVNVPVINEGATNDLVVTGASVSGTHAPGFTVLSDFSSPLVLGPGATGSIALEVDPSQLPAGAVLDATLEVTSNDVLRPLSEVPIEALVFGPYLDGVFPATVPGSATGWTTENAFPGISFIDPMWMKPYPGTNDLVLATKQGEIFRFPNDPAVTQAEVVRMLDIRGQVATGIDMGFYSFAFHPGFGQAGSPGEHSIFTCYTSNFGGRSFTLSRWELNPTTRVVDSAETVLISQYDPDSLHNGGAMFFGPDGFLYLTNGDSGIPDPLNYAQRVDHGLFAGVLRIDVDMDPAKSHPIRRQPNDDSSSYVSYTENYWIPNDNPFVVPDGNGDPYDTPASVLEEFYAIGLRSPHSMHFDPVSGQVWIGDVGGGAREELSLLTLPGSNFQWGFREGFVNGPKAVPNPVLGTEVPPILDYNRNTTDPLLDGVPLGANVCVIAGPIYRGSRFPALQGKMIFGDHSNGKIWALDHTPGQAPQVEFLSDFAKALKVGIANFCCDADGEIYIMNVNGTNQPGGTVHTLAEAGVTADPPTLLSQTGAFTDLATLTPSPALLSYEVASPLWSDDAAKHRWISVPTDGLRDTPDEKIVFSEADNWEFPAGTVIVKHFELSTDETDPAVTTRLETRFIVCTENGGKYGVTYRWLPDQSDAVLLTAGETGDYPISEAGGGTRIQTWDFPSRSDCLQCHTAAAGQALGVRTHQLNHEALYPDGQTRNQLAFWNSLGMFDQDLSANQIANFLQARALDDETAPLEHRVRSYLDANCAHCHRDPGSSFDARLATPLADQDLINGVLQGNYSFTGSYVTPGDVALSAVHFRTNHAADADAMPPLAKRLVHDEAVQQLAAWIRGLTPSEFEDAGGTRPVRALLGGPRDEQLAPFEVTLILDESSSGVGIEDFAVGNGTLTNLVGSGYYYTATIAPSGSPVEITYLSGSSTGSSGNGNAVSNTLVVPEWTAFAQWAADAGLTGPDAELLADPDGNGLENILEFGFNIAPGAPLPSIYDPAAPVGPGGPGGLPLVDLVEIPPGELRLRVRYLRRTAALLDGFTYQAQFTSHLGGGWDPASLSETVTPLAAGWELVTVVDATGYPLANERFARVSVSGP